MSTTTCVRYVIQGLTNRPSVQGSSIPSAASANKMAPRLHSTRTTSKRLRLLAICVAALFTGSATDAMSSESKNFSQSATVSKLLSANCLDCHDKQAVEDAIANDSHDRRVQLDNLDKLDVKERLDILNRVQEQVFTDRMPPKKKMTTSDSEALLTWVSSELTRHKASTLEDKLRYYKYANYINHDKLFSGEIQDMPFTPARRWRINEFIYQNLVRNIFGTLNGRKKGFDSEYPRIVQPFNLPAEPGVKYYDTEIVEGAEFLTLLDNAKYIVRKQLATAVKQKNSQEAPAHEEGNAQAKGSGKVGSKKGKTKEDPKGATDPVFEKIVLSAGNLTDADLGSAINLQFTLAYQRSPTTEEMSKYLQFMKAGIKTGGAQAALEKMMVSVLMGADFLYRSEFGDGQRDAYGRTKLTPREASYALAYALTDRIPDATLVEAANSGKLSTKEDYRREVLRMLGDDTLEKPRILRFFQDFFGYYAVYGIFKDEKRFGSSYNPHRAASRLFRWRVPEKVTEEADLFVLSILKEDKDVLRQLLTSDKYFVHHNGNNAEMSKLANAAAEADKKYRTEAYPKLKSLSGEKLNKAQKAFSQGPDRKLMTYISGLFNPDLPNRKPVPYFDEALPYAISMYNLDPRTWSYEANQPFKVEHRMGMLTHPAWLVSFAKNAETDPIRRGKWIQEKLLAGVIPDVPISVPAMVPEIHDQTLRQRISGVTDAKYCSSCHQKMNPLGMPFESYDDFGRYRTEEMLENEENFIKKENNPGKPTNIYKTLPVVSSGALYGTGDKNLDGEVTNALDLITRLGKSERVRQSFVRNVFRYFMGRNEMLSDSKTLIEADKAYVESGGSFKALMVSLLTSDSFIYRK